MSHDVTSMPSYDCDPQAAVSALLQKVARRYHVHPREILEAAPYLFVLFAEQLLDERQRNPPSARVGRVYPGAFDPFRRIVERMLEGVGESELAEEYAVEHVRRVAPGNGTSRAMVGSVVCRNEARKHRWVLRFRGRERVVTSGIDALCAVLRWIVNNVEGAASRLKTVHGRKRPLVAAHPKELYPGRPDLVQYSREISPGMYVGTNYSHTDVVRLMRSAVEAVGLKWGADVSVSHI